MFLLIILLEYFFKLQNLDFCFVEQQSYSMLVQVTCDCIRNFIKYFHKILELVALKILKLYQSQTKVRDTENISLIFSIKLFHMQMISLQIVLSEYFNKIVDFGALAILELNYRQSRASLELKTSKIFLLPSVLSYLNCILCLQQFHQNISLDYTIRSFILWNSRVRLDLGVLFSSPAKSTIYRLHPGHHKALGMVSEYFNRIARLAPLLRWNTKVRLDSQRYRRNHCPCHWQSLPGVRESYHHRGF